MDTFESDALMYVGSTTCFMWRGSYGERGGHRMITTTVEGGERRRPSSSNTRIQQQSRGRGVKQKKQNSTKCWQLLV